MITVTPPNRSLSSINIIDTRVKVEVKKICKDTESVSVYAKEQGNTVKYYKVTIMGACPE